MKIWNLVAILAMSCLLPILAQKQDNAIDTAGSICENELGQFCIDKNDTHKCMFPLAKPECPAGKQCCKTFPKDYDSAGLPLTKGKKCTKKCPCCIASVEGRIADVDSGMKGVEGVIADVDSAMKGVERKIDNVESALKGGDGEMFNVESAMKGVEGKCDNMSSAMKGVEEVIADMDSAMKGVEGKIDNVESALKGGDGEMFNVESAMKGVEGKIADMDSAMKGVEGKMDDVDSEMKSVEGKIADVDSVMKGVEEKIADMDSAMKGVEGKMDDVDSEMKGVEEKMTNVESAMNGVEEKMTNLISVMKDQLSPLYCAIKGITYGDSCYYFSSSVAATMSDAQAKCVDMGGNLVKIDNDEEFSFLQAQVTEVTKHFWIGLNDIEVEGQYTWISDGSIHQIQASWWYPGNPSDSGGNEDCVHFWQGQILLNDMICSYAYAFYICEMPFGNI